ncbi:hypothetical protein K1719_034373 [Acacia pycnantha]|nr:hypothetical protein K1719_034373 [Acacia pycnantha]
MEASPMLMDPKPSSEEEYVKDEQKNLKRELLRAQKRSRGSDLRPLVIGRFMEMVDQNNGIVGSTTGSNYYVRILSTINHELLKPSASVALHRHSNALVDVLPPEADSSISLLSQSEKPDVTYNDIGGCDIQKQEIREAVELPLTHHELYKQIGIDPPRGVLLYSPHGTGKTMLAKAIANHTTAAFIRVVGSEFVQKYLGEGPRMVRDVFRLAKENAPAIIFIDEVDAIATARFDAQTGADREVQRILMELLNQMDGFDQTVNVKVIMATNRADTLDPALLRPGRLDRKIEFPLPDRRQKRLVFQVCTAKMNLGDEVDLEDYVSRPDRISAAEITAICQEAGMHAVRKNRDLVIHCLKNYMMALKDGVLLLEYSGFQEVEWHAYTFSPLAEILKHQERNFDDHLTDVVAFVKSIGSLEEFRRDKERKNKLRMLLTDAENNDLECVLFDERSTNAYMGTPAVVVLNLLTESLLCLFSRRPQVCSSFSATRVLFNPAIQEVKDMIESSKDYDSFVTPSISQLMPYQSSQEFSSNILRNNNKILIPQILDQMIFLQKLEMSMMAVWKKPESVEPKIEVHYTIADKSGVAIVIFWDMLGVELLGKSAPELNMILKEA